MKQKISELDRLENEYIAIRSKIHTLNNEIVDYIIDTCNNKGIERIDFEEICDDFDEDAQWIEYVDKYNSNEILNASYITVTKDNLIFNDELYYYSKCYIDGCISYYLGIIINYIDSL